MVRRPLLVALALLAAPLAVVPVSPVAADGDPSVTAQGRLRSDAEHHLTLDRGADGRLRFIGVQRGVIDNPKVDGGDSVSAAARAHLDRYGAALDAARGTTYVQRSVAHTVAGTDLVRFGQEVDGVPVLGGEIVVGLGRAHDLRSLAADVAARVTVTDATVSSTAARRTALGLVERGRPHADLAVTDLGRWVLDPAVSGLDLPGGDRTVRRLEVGNGAGIRDLVLVDDHTGHVVFRTSLIEHADKVVCDDADQRSAETPCTGNFARTEATGPSAVSDVNDAFDFAQEVSDFYGTISGGQIDLTQMLGVSVPGGRKLAATVRFCTNTKSDGVSYDDPCPYQNAFWNGTQMYYGDGFAAADDVVGHEMTHGVIDQYSQLFYWGQSGAINESLADTMGEFVDHRNGTDTDSAWNLGEDLPGGALRNMKDPTIDGQPDTMTSALYTADAGYADAGGVHTNSGVGNKTAYLISQGTGGTPFNGRTFSGIDAGDPSLSKTATLYLSVIQGLASGADYADLAAQLDQSCADLLAAGTAGFTSADCAVVHQATLATELTTTPTNASQPADAPTGCPVNTAKRVLLDSESGTTADQQARFSTATSPGIAPFTRSTSSWGSNAASGQSSWFVPDQPTAGQSLLYASSATALPAGQKSYLSFQGWNLLDYDNNGNYDGGLVEVNIDNQTNHYDATSGWVNGPTGALASGTGNARGGDSAFVGDSRGWVRSRYDLSQWAGHEVTPRFSLFTDTDPAGHDYSLIGWYLDDITIYTCDPVMGRVADLRVTGFVGGMHVSWSAPAVNPDAVATYTVVVQPCGTVLTVPASTTSVDLKIRPATCGSRYEVTVYPRDALGRGPTGPSPDLSPRVVAWLGMLALHPKRHGARVTFKGGLFTSEGRHPVGVTVLLQRKTSTGWVTIRTLRTKLYGRYVTTIRDRKRAYYRVVYAGGPGVVGKATRRYRA